jgi:hypothetical protein
MSSKTFGCAEKEECRMANDERRARTSGFTMGRERKRLQTSFRLTFGMDACHRALADCRSKTFACQIAGFLSV